MKALSAAALGVFAALSMSGALGVSDTFGVSDDEPSIAQDALETAHDDFEKTNDELEIVQLGDSFSSGNGTGNYYNIPCQRSEQNYGSQVADALETDGYEVTFIDASCGGARIANLVDAVQEVRATSRVEIGYYLPQSVYPDQRAEWLRRAEDNRVCETQPRTTPSRASTREPLPGTNQYWQYSEATSTQMGSVYSGTIDCQLFNDVQTTAITPKTDVVLLTIGGNETNYGELVSNCFVLRNPFTCDEEMDIAREIVATEARAKLDSALDAIEQANPNAQVYLLNYPDLINSESYIIPPGGWYDVAAMTNQLQSEYDDVQREAIAARSDRFTFVDVKPAFDGHGIDLGLFANQDHSWIVPPLGSFDVRGYMHPTIEGWTAMADVALEEVEKDLPDRSTTKDMNESD